MYFNHLRISAHLLGMPPEAQGERLTNDERRFSPYPYPRERPRKDGVKDPFPSSLATTPPDSCITSSKSNTSSNVSFHASFTSDYTTDDLKLEDICNHIPPLSLPPFVAPLHADCRPPFSLVISLTIKDQA